jgi:LPXTG-motif cell wall-anchored protein
VPKKKSKRKATSAPNEDQRYEARYSRRNRMVKWASISIIIALVMSLLAAAVSVAPSSAATRPFTSSESPTPCLPIDTDGDGITNDIDPDIDGDDIVNGLDEDIDGDGTPNVSDTDPAATNCGADAELPLIQPEPENSESQTDTTWIGVVGVALLGFGYLVLRRFRRAKK